MISYAEPNVLIGFAGPRVIGNTIKENLPDGFQKSEYLLDHGMIDMVSHRKDLKNNITSILDILTNSEIKNLLVYNMLKNDIELFVGKFSENLPRSLNVFMVYLLKLIILKIVLKCNSYCRD